MAIDDAEPLEDERDVELSSIAAIFPELEVEPPTSSERRAHVDVEVNLDTPIRVSFAPLSRAATNVSLASQDGHPDHGQADQVGTDSGQLSVSLFHLPSLSCHITLPDSYPTDVGPQITLDCDTPWLATPKLTQLEQQALVLWEDNGRSEVLYDYLDWLNQAAANGFDLTGQSTPEVFLLPRQLEAPLLDFDLQTKKRKFAAETFDCGVCLEPKKGAACHRMSQCGHVFCIACLQAFYNACITEGTVANVKCLDPSCEKARLQGIPERRRKRLDLTIKPSELAEIPLDQDQIQRFAHLKQRRELETNGNVVFCPRKWCQGAARSEKKPKGLDDPDTSDEDESSASTNPHRFGERLAICSECGFAFCSRCLTGPWHGEHVACRRPRTTAELTAEERATENYLTAHSARCPTCGVPTQKMMGCNHMICQLCRTHFCYLCQAYLLEGNPYAHFNTPGLGCYMQLWVLEGGDEAGAAPPEALPNEDLAALAAVAAPEADAAPPPAAVPPAAPDPPVEHEDVELDPAFIVFEEDTSSSEEDEVAPPAAAAAPRGRGRGRGGQQRGARGRGRGRGHPDRAIQRFVQMAMHDQEDQWDSDELDSDDDDGEWIIPVRGRVP